MKIERITIILLFLLVIALSYKIQNLKHNNKNNNTVNIAEIKNSLSISYYINGNKLNNLEIIDENGVNININSILLDTTIVFIYNFNDCIECLKRELFRIKKHLPNKYYNSITFFVISENQNGLDVFKNLYFSKGRFYYLKNNKNITKLFPITPAFYIVNSNGTIINTYFPTEYSEFIPNIFYNYIKKLFLK